MHLKTKITVIIAVLVLGVVGASSWLYLDRLTRQVIRQADDRANLVAQQVFFQAQNALIDAASQGLKPASSKAIDMRDYIRVALDQNSSLTSLIGGEVGYSSLVYEVTIVDGDGVALVSSDDSLPGKKVMLRPPLSQLVNARFTQQLALLYGAPQAYEVSYPFKLGPRDHQVPFGDIRVAVQTGLLAGDITPALRSAGWLALASVLISVFLATAVSNAALSPLGRISAQLDLISRGEFDEKPLERADEFGQVSTKISQIGQQLRGVREIFSTFRENVDQFLGGLEDGLLLFTRDGRAVMVSPAVEKFLGLAADQLLGRKAAEIFPQDHPLRPALLLDGDELVPSAPIEIDLPAESGRPPHRIGVNVQIVTEGGTRMGALVKLRDMQSREGLKGQLQLSALSQVTAGVAHEVKNPLNSMRLWLENLKDCMPVEDGLPRQAINVLDSEIDRLDSVVKRFLDFMRPAELQLEEADLGQIMTEAAAIARPQAERSAVRIELRLEKLPAVLADQALLKQAFLNLVFNSIQAMPSGGVLTLEVRRRGGMAEISVQDTGTGIPVEHRPRVFQLFFTTRRGGSGIGLASAYKTVQLHDGLIGFESELGRGTTFRIELPLERASELASVHGRTAGNTLPGRI